MGKPDRLARLRKLCSKLEIDAVLITSPYNVRYFTGFTGTEGSCLVTRKDALFFTDSRYKIQAGSEAAGFDVQIFTEKASFIADRIKDLSIKNLGMEAIQVPYADWMRYCNLLSPLQPKPINTEIDSLRMIKEPEEIASIRKAIAVSDKALAAVIPMIKPGAVERDISLALEFEQRKLGATAMSFELIVASGYRGALPHGVASDKAIERGDMLVIDFGCICEGYCSDQTVTFAVGEPGSDARKVYQIVLDAQRKAIAAARPGMHVADLDKVARDHIESMGHGPDFGHGLGHGLGLFIHENPRISRLGQGVLEKNMVFTIEPGIYLEGRFGVRIEDMVLVTDTGIELLTSLDKTFTLL